MHRGHGQNYLAGEHRIGDIGQLTLFLLFMSFWISDMFLEYSSFLNEYVPVWVRLPIGVLLLITSAYMAKTGLSIIFGRNAQTQGVVKKGVFGWVRHPIYLSELLLYLALLVIQISLTAFIILVLAIIFLYYISRYEERLLMEKYGDEYRQYMREVPMWLPRFKKNK